MKTPMKVDFKDTVENWRLWGELVELWACKRHDWPDTAGKLENQMTAHGITDVSVPGAPDRVVKFWQYSNDDPLVILLPTKEMLADGRKKAKSGEPYPLPEFYQGAYAGKQKIFDTDEDTRFAACRIGEYTINMCM